MAVIALLALTAERIPNRGMIMKKRYLLGAAALSALLGCLESESTNEIQANESRETKILANTTTPDGKYSWDRFATMLDDALGTFNDIDVFKQTDGEWQLLSGQYVPVTVDGQPVADGPTPRSDRPMMLPTRVQGEYEENGQTMKYSVAGRMPGSNPEVQWVFVVRKYVDTNPKKSDFDDSPDIAVIGHHPRTGATGYIQFYNPEHPQSGATVISPWSEGAEEFWNSEKKMSPTNPEFMPPVQRIADKFECQRCHASGPFIHSAWANQVRVRENDTTAEGIVPSDPLGPFFFVDSAPGGAFEKWNDKLLASTGGGHLDAPQNQCTQCHRIAHDMIGLNINSTRYAGVERPTRKDLESTNQAAWDATYWSAHSDEFQTDEFQKLHWMPPIGRPSILEPYVAFYSGQSLDPEHWDPIYKKDATTVNQAVQNESSYEQTKRLDLPRPPQQYQTILVDRPNTDSIGANETLWLIDTRMKANTDARMQQWQFIGKGSNENVKVAPVVYARIPNNGSTVEYEVRFVGTARDLSSAGQFIDIGDSSGYQLKQGEFLGAVFTNAGSESASATIPYTDDDWAQLKFPDGTPWMREGSVTYRATTTDAPSVGTKVTFGNPAFRTYSFEFKNQL